MWYSCMLDISEKVTRGFSNQRKLCRSLVQPDIGRGQSSRSSPILSQGVLRCSASDWDLDGRPPCICGMIGIFECTYAKSKINCDITLLRCTKTICEFLRRTTHCHFIVIEFLVQMPPLTALLAHPSCLHRFILAPSVTQMPPLLALLAHPSWLHRFLVAPYVMQTPPLTTPLAHPSWLQRFLVAPCVTQTPPLTACLAHPSWLQRFTFAPCVMQMPPLLAPLAHPSWLQQLVPAPCVMQTPSLMACLAHPSWLQCLVLHLP